MSTRSMSTPTPTPPQAPARFVALGPPHVVLPGRACRIIVTLIALLLTASATRAGAPAPDERVRPGEWNRKDPPPGWVVIETDHYQVQSQVGEETGRELAEHLEAMLEVYADVLPFRRKIKTFVLKIFANRNAMLAYRPSAVGAAAWYDKGNRELVAYDTGVILGRGQLAPRLSLSPRAEELFGAGELRRIEELFHEITGAFTYDVAKVLSHEGWHQYFHHYTVSWVAMPSWLDEGLGDYFFTAERRAQESEYALGEINHNRLRVVKRALDDGTTVSFEELITYEQADYYSNASVYYAQGWSMVYFLMHHDDEAYRRLIPKLIKDFKDTKNFDKSSKRAFRRIDLTQLDREWIGWVLRTDVYDPLETLAREFGERLEPEDLGGSASLIERYAWHRARLFEADDALEEERQSGDPAGRTPSRGGRGKNGAGERN